jgi:hypothetical protein
MITKRVLLDLVVESLYYVGQKVEGSDIEDEDGNIFFSTFDTKFMSTAEDICCLLEELGVANRVGQNFRFWRVDWEKYESLELD